MQIDRSNIVRSDFVPNGIYTLLVKKVDNTPAGTGTPQSKLELQIVAPEFATLGGQQYNVAGKDITYRMWFTDKSMGRALDVVRDLGCADAADNAQTTEEVQSAMTSLEGCYVQAVVESRERFKRATPLPGQKNYEAPVLKREDGSPVSDGYEVTVASFERGTTRRPDGQPF